MKSPRFASIWFGSSFPEASSFALTLSSKADKLQVKATNLEVRSDPGVEDLETWNTQKQWIGVDRCSSQSMARRGTLA